MKKIYISLAVMAAVVQLNAQSNITISEDQKAGLGIPVKMVDLSAVKHRENSPALHSPAGCDSMLTTTAGGNSQNGNMFDLTNTSAVAIQIASIEQCFAGTTSDTLEVYYIPGTFIGNETTSSAWTMVGKAAMSPTVTGTPLSVPISINVSIPAGQTYGFYVTLRASNVAYTNGTSVGNVYQTANGLEFKEGKGVAYPFGGNFSPRIWNGVINYCSPLILGVEEMNTAGNLSVYPNPASSYLTVKSVATSFTKAKVTIKDVTGRLVYSQDNISESEIRINTENLKSGIYMLQVENGNLLTTKKISIQ